MNSIKTYVNSLGRATRTVLLGLAVVFVSAGIAQAATTISTNILTDGALTVAGATTLNGDMVFGNALSDTLALGVATTTFSDTSTLATGNMNGATLTSMLLTPKASVTTAGVNYHKLVSVGDVTGTTAFGFGDVGKPTTGIMASFGRTIAATSPITDTGLDVRVINKLDNSGTTYNIQGAYIKAKNYSGAGKVANIKGLFIDTINDGTVSGSSHGLYFGTDSSTITDVINMSAAKAAYGLDMSGATIGTADIRLSSGNIISNPASNIVSINGFVLKTVTSGVTGAGTDRDSATALTSELNIITAGAATTGVRLPQAVAGMDITILNNQGSTMHLYATGTAPINGLAATVGRVIDASLGTRCLAMSDNVWFCNKVGADED